MRLGENYSVETSWLINPGKQVGSTFTALSFTFWTFQQQNTTVLEKNVSIVYAMSEDDKILQVKVTWMEHFKPILHAQQPFVHVYLHNTIIPTCTYVTL